MHTTSRAHARNMCVWVRRIISSTPVSSIRISCEEPLAECPRDVGHNISYDGLVDHLVAKHRKTLVRLRLPCAYVGGRRLDMLVNEETFPFLEDLEVRVTHASLVSVYELPFFRKPWLDLTITPRSRRSRTSHAIPVWPQGNWT